MRPPSTFLSRWRAAQARSGSTRTGRGRSTSSTTSVSSPERRSAARRPSATASPCETAPPEAASSAWAALRRDKKVEGGRIRLVLLEAPGRPIAGAELSEPEVRAALDALISG